MSVKYTQSESGVRVIVSRNVMMQLLCEGLQVKSEILILMGTVCGSLQAFITLALASFPGLYDG